MMLCGIRHEHCRHTRVEPASENCGQTCLLETLAVSPLPAIFEMSLILRLIVGGVEIVDATLKACLHDGQILIGESYIDTDIGLVTVEKLTELLNRVGIHLIGGDVGRTDTCCKTVAFLFRARRYDDFRENVRILGTFRCHYCADASGADDNNFSHDRYYI